MLPPTAPGTSEAVLQEQSPGPCSLEASFKILLFRPKSQGCEIRNGAQPLVWCSFLNHSLSFIK